MKKAGFYLTVSLFMLVILGLPLLGGLYVGSIISKILFGSSIIF